MTRRARVLQGLEVGGKREKGGRRRARVLRGMEVGGKREKGGSLAHDRDIASGNRRATELLQIGLVVIRRYPSISIEIRCNLL